MSTDLKQRRVMSPTDRRFGYGIAIFVNLVMLVVVQNILDWGILSFLTPEFATVVPWMTFSIIVSIIVYAVFMITDSPTVVSFGRIIMNLTSLLATWRLLEVFPFDFTGYEFDWTLATRAVLILTIVGTVIGAVVEAVRLARPRIEAISRELTSSTRVS